MTKEILDEHHKNIERILNDFYENLDHETSEYKIIKINLIAVSKAIVDLRIKSVVENNGKSNKL